MAEHVRRHLLFLFLASLLTVASAALTGRAITGVNAQAIQTKALDRNLEPVVVKGSQVAALANAPVGDLFVYVFSGDSLSGQIPVQVDEVTASGTYTTTEDGLLDADDEIVFMAGDVGDQPSDTSALIVLPINPSWYEIEVIDPNSGKKGWAYLVRSSSLPHPSVDYVDYITTTRRITTDPTRYELGLATTYVGLDYLTLNGNTTDILDRTKLRAILDASILGQMQVTEAWLGNPDIVLIKDGRVRVILQQTVTAGSTGPIPIDEAKVTMTYLAYASLLQGNAVVSFTLPSYVDLLSVRTSVDLNSAASGAKFHNANISNVTIDGSGLNEGVAPIPLSNWTQVSHSTGRVVQVVNLAGAGGTHKNYYCDDTISPTECDSSDPTGDGDSYGDAGIVFEGNVNQSFTIESWLFVLPPAGGQDNIGATYEDYFFNRLRATAYLQGERTTTYLPIILRNSQ